MPERWVLNASPLIALAKIDQLHLLTGLGAEIVVPQAVADEIDAGPSDDAARRWLGSLPVPIVPAAVEPDVLAWDLGAGESAVLSHAYRNQGWTVVLDDRAARRCAHALAIPVIGTLGIILRAKKEGLIQEAVPILKKLQGAGFHLDDHVVAEALRAAVGEVWE